MDEIQLIQAAMEAQRQGGRGAAARVYAAASTFERITTNTFIAHTTHMAGGRHYPVRSRFLDFIRACAEGLPIDGRRTTIRYQIDK